MTTPPVVDYDQIARQLKLKPQQVRQTVELLDEENTVPFITRYRKEQTGGLDETQIRDLQAAVKSRRAFVERVEAVLRLIDEQGKLTPELREAIITADSLSRVEDLYLPYRPKRRTRAMTARERGLEPLADLVWNGTRGDRSLDDLAEELTDAEKELPDRNAVLSGVRDILAERIAENPDVRQRCRRIARRSGRLVVTATKEAREKAANEGGKKKKGKASEFSDYFDFSEAISGIPPHRLLAINRGEEKKILRVNFEWDAPRAATELSIYLRTGGHPDREFLGTVIDDALDRLLLPSLAREVRRERTEQAQAHAVEVFAQNLRGLLLGPPLQDARVLAIDPGFRTGCKLAVLDESGNLIAHEVIHLTTDEAKAAAIETLKKLVTEHEVKHIAIGNGTACRETEELVGQLIAEHTPDARYLVVNEAGASIYSASPLAQEEFPDLDATVRGTVSIGRRLQDPLSELVKIDPEHIGVGMYQHDLDGKQLREALDVVVESCVNFVGVDLNTASVPLLKHVAGLNQLSANRIVEHRATNGPFNSREQLMSVSSIGPATFTQAAGFLRVRHGTEPLDTTPIHPESYDAARSILSRLELDTGVLTDAERFGEAERKQIETLSPTELAGELNIGGPTVRDILGSLARPGRDPRGDLPAPVFRSGVLSVDDLELGMELKGTVLNVVDFGAFVDVGLKQSGLVHISQMSPNFVKNPHDHVTVGDVITVWVVSIDKSRDRISLTMVKGNVK